MTEGEWWKEEEVITVPPSSVSQWVTLGAAAIESKNIDEGKIVLPKGWIQKDESFYDTDGYERATMNDQYISYRPWQCEFFSVEEAKKKAADAAAAREARLAIFRELISKSQNFFDVPTPTPIVRGNITACQARLVEYLDANKDKEYHFRCICTTGPLAGKLVNDTLEVLISTKRELTYGASVASSVAATHDAKAHDAEVRAYLTKGLSRVETVRTARSSVVELIVRDDIKSMTAHLATLLHENVTGLRYIYPGCGLFGLFGYLDIAQLCIGYFNIRQLRALIDTSVKLSLGPTSNIEPDLIKLFEADGVAIVP